MQTRTRQVVQGSICWGDAASRSGEPPLCKLRKKGCKHSPSLRWDACLARLPADAAAALRRLSRKLRMPLQVTFPSFLSPAEVGHMVTVSRDHLERSEVGVPTVGWDPSHKGSLSRGPCLQGCGWTGGLVVDCTSGLQRAGLHIPTACSSCCPPAQVLVGEGQETKSDVRTSFGFWPEQDEVIRRIQVRPGGPAACCAGTHPRRRGASGWRACAGARGAAAKRSGPSKGACCRRWWSWWIWWWRRYKMGRWRRWWLYRRK